MYLVDFFKRLGRKSNIPVIIYLVLNVFVIGLIMQLLFAGEGIQFWAALLIGLGVYLVSLVIALSPVGEWILRMQTGCKKITDPNDLQALEPIFREVHQKAKALDPTIPDDVKLFINEDEAPNAFATGRKTVCVTRGLLQMPVEQIKATLGHEFGHLAHKDTDLILVVSVGNMIVTALITFVRIMIELFRVIMLLVSAIVGGSEGAFAAAITSLYSVMITVVINGLMWVWTKVGTLLVMKSSRSNEFEADEFSFKCGYGNELCALLDNIDGGGAQGIFATLVSSHPHKDKRIAKLQALGATYRQLP